MKRRQYTWASLPPTVKTKLLTDANAGRLTEKDLEAAGLRSRNYTALMQRVQRQAAAYGSVELAAANPAASNGSSRAAGSHDGLNQKLLSERDELRDKLAALQKQADMQALQLAECRGEVARLRQKVNLLADLAKE